MRQTQTFVLRIVAGDANDAVVASRPSVRRLAVQPNTGPTRQITVTAGGLISAAYSFLAV